MAAWAAATGCVTVQARPAPPQPPSGRPAEVVEPQIVQGPAHEVLKPPAVDTVNAVDETTAHPPQPIAEPLTREGAEPRPPKPRAVERPAPPRRPPTPPAPPAPVVGPDICALGESYGHWRPDSPEARICPQVYPRNRS
ncbi:hypothetical protein ACQEVG_13400 [Streptomyces sp. CA-135486]|uniref:hypothetical protein n=1 Tax=Streptomyces sp. CA-135486 TaxID=3240049 RepID=UPI003D934733